MIIFHVLDVGAADLQLFSSFRCDCGTLLPAKAKTPNHTHHHIIMILCEPVHLLSSPTQLSIKQQQAQSDHHARPSLLSFLIAAEPQENSKAVLFILESEASQAMACILALPSVQEPDNINR